MKKAVVIFLFLSKTMLTLLSTDNLFVYGFFEAELNMSPKILSAIKKGEDMCISHYLRVINLVMEIIGLTILLAELYEQIRQVLIEHKDMVIATVPHKKQGICKPDEWVTIIKWNK